ncbi:MAG: hypothetical protein Q3962_00505 [Corynebacterium sp.]|nr:hypothetical protein [Corynebacterium sp.]
MAVRSRSFCGKMALAAMLAISTTVTGLSPVPTTQAAESDNAALVRGYIYYNSQNLSYSYTFVLTNNGPVPLVDLHLNITGDIQWVNGSPQGTVVTNSLKTGSKNIFPAASFIGSEVTQTTIDNANAKSANDPSLAYLGAGQTATVSLNGIKSASADATISLDGNYRDIVLTSSVMRDAINHSTAADLQLKIAEALLITSGQIEQLGVTTALSNHFGWGTSSYGRAASLIAQASKTAEADAYKSAAPRFAVGEEYAAFNNSRTAGIAKANQVIAALDGAGDRLRESLQGEGLGDIVGASGYASLVDSALDDARKAQTAINNAASPSDLSTALASLEAASDKAANAMAEFATLMATEMQKIKDNPPITSDGAARAEKISTALQDSVSLTDGLTTAMGENGTTAANEVKTAATTGSELLSSISAEAKVNPLTAIEQKPAEVTSPQADSQEPTDSTEESVEDMRARINLALTHLLNLSAEDQAEFRAQVASISTKEGLIDLARSIAERNIEQSSWTDEVKQYQLAQVMQQDSLDAIFAYSDPVVPYEQEEPTTSASQEPSTQQGFSKNTWIMILLAVLGLGGLVATIANALNTQHL